MKESYVSNKHNDSILFFVQNLITNYCAMQLVCKFESMIWRILDCLFITYSQHALKNVIVVLKYNDRILRKELRKYFIVFLTILLR